MVKKGMDHLFSRHLLDSFREKAIKEVMEEERRDFEMGMEFEGVNK